MAQSSVSFAHAETVAGGASKLTMSIMAPLWGSLMPRPSDHSQYDGGEEAE